MDLSRTEEKNKLKKDKSKEAIAMALKGDWEMAVQTNQEILRVFPDDVESLNRLGKSFLELGRYNAARAAFANAVVVSPYNSIAKKNLERLDHLQDSSHQPKQGRVVTPNLLIEDSGKSGITVLHKPGTRTVLAKMAAGDAVNLKVLDHSLNIEDSQGEYVGKVEPKLALRLLRLMKAGNKYEAAVVSVDRPETSIVIWETLRHPDVGNVCSFPTRTKEEHRIHLKDAMLSYDIDNEMEEDDEKMVAEWKAGYPDESGLTESEEPAEAPYPHKAVESEGNEDDEEEE